MSDADGNIDAGFTVPFGADPGTYTVTANDGSSPQVSADVTVEANASITSITPDPADPGATLDIEGTDFPAGAAVSAVVTCGAASQDTPGTVDADGNLSVQASVPDDAPAGEGHRGL